MTIAYAYGRDSRVTGLTYGANGTQLGNLAYTYDADGRRAALGGSLAAVNPPANASGDAFNRNIRYRVERVPEPKIAYV